MRQKIGGAIVSPQTCDKNKIRFLEVNLDEKKSFHIWWMIVGTAYGNTVFYWAGILAPNRALSAGANRMGEASLAGVVGYLPAIVFALVVMVAMVIVARAAFSEDL